MTDIARLTLDVAAAARWTARTLGTLMVLFILMFLVGEGPPPLSRFTSRELLLALAMTMLFGGLVLAWFREGWGGLVSILGWIIFCVGNGRVTLEWPIAIPAALGLLHLLCWFALRNQEAVALSRPALFAILIPLGMFALLFANELLGMPPLMTPRAAPLTGTWSDETARVTLTIRDDGTVSGTIGDQPVSMARFTRNRSWFGELLHWRTDYIVIGELAGHGRFTMPLNPSGADLRGSLFRGPHGKNPPARVHLTRK